MQIAQENTAYELTIEDMARQNNDLEEELFRIKVEDMRLVH